jgi:hypothetical protein
VRFAPSELGEELDDLLCDEFAGILKREVAGVEQVKFGVGDVPQICLRTFDGEEGIVFAPHNEGLRLLAAEELMPVVVACKVRLIVVQQVELDGVVARTVEEVLIHGVRVGADARRALRAVRVLEDRRFLLEQLPYGLLGFRVAGNPKRLHGVESCANAFDVGVAVLYDDSFDSVLMFRGDLADGRAIILHVDAELL